MYRQGSLIASVSGIRGILGEGMNPETAARCTASYAASVEDGVVIVGRDTRPSGPALASAVFSALLFRGIDIVDLGISSTPTVEIMVRELKAAGGIIITASHNGPEWNALKFLGSNGEVLPAEDMEAIGRLLLGGEPLFDVHERSGAIVQNDTGDDVHIRKLLELECVDRQKVASAGLRAVVDCVNGAGSRIVPALLRSLGVDVIELFTDMGAPFPHVPEPRPEYLAELSKAVKGNNADVGFACDPDADRLVLVDETGEVCSEELTLCIAADFVLEREKGPLVANLSTTRLIDDIGRKHGVEVHRCSVGEANVISAMKQKGAVIGGEGSGGVIYPRIHYGRDAMTGIVLVLQALAGEGVSLGEKVAALPKYSMIKQKFPFSGELREVEEALMGKFSGECNRLDGIRIDMERCWIHLRRSNTEPVVRAIAEAGTRKEALELVRAAGEILMSGGGTAL